MINFLAALVVLVSGTSSHAVEALGPVFTGKIGKNLEVALRLSDPSEGKPAGRYFYLKSKKEIPLCAKGKIGSWDQPFVLEECGQPGKVTGIWKMDGISGSTLKGTWSDPKGKKSLVIDLKSAASGQYAVLLRGIEEEKEEKTLGSIRYRLIHEKRKSGKLVYPRIVAGAASESIKKLNATFETMATQEGCGEEDEPGEEGSGDSGMETTDYSIELKKTARDLVIVHLQGEVMCAGMPHSNYTDATTTYDLKTGNEVTAKDIFKDYEKSKERILKLAFSELRSLDPEGKVKLGDCGDGETMEVSEFMGSVGIRVGIDEGGVSFATEFPHVLLACSSSGILKISDAKKFEKKGGVLSRF